MFPLTLITLWFVTRSIFNERIALFSVIFLGSILSFFWKSAVLSAASLTQILGLLAFYAIEKDKKIATPVLFTLMLYSHIAIPYFYFASFIVYAFFRKEKRKLIFTSSLISFAAFSPWLIHLLKNMQYLHSNNAIAQRDILVPKSVPIYIFLYGFGIVGAIYSIIRKKEYLWPLILLILLIPIAFFYPSRFWDAHAFIPLSILAAFGTWYLCVFILKAAGNKKTISYVILFVLIIATIIKTPVLNVSKIPNVSLVNSTLPALIKVNRNNESLLRNGSRNDVPNSILNERNLQLATFIKTKVQQGETVYIPNGALADFIFAFSKHPVSSGMLKEVKPYKRPLPTDCAFFIIPGNVEGLPPGLNSHFILFDTISGYTIFKNKYPVEPVIPERPALPNWAAFLLVYSSIAVSVYDLVKNKPFDK